MQIVIEGLQAIKNQLLGNIASLNMANDFIMQGRE
jgi:hypothetical protein